MILLPESVLILGAGGPLGVAIARGLSREGAAVTATGRSSGPETLDVSEWHKVSERISNLSPTTVIYLVNATLGRDFRTSADNAVANLRNVLNATSLAPVRRFVFASSAAVYGDHGASPFREGDPRSGTTNYALLKSELERVVEEHSNSASMKTAALRIFNVFGPGFKTSLINKLLNPAITPELAVSENYVRDYVYSEDVVAAIISFIEFDIVGHSIFNIGSGRAMSNARLAQLFSEKSFHATSYKGHSWSVSDIKKASTELNFVPKMSVEDYVDAHR